MSEQESFVEPKLVPLFTEQQIALRIRELGPVSYTHLDVYKRQVLDAQDEQDLPAAGQELAPDELHYDAQWPGRAEGV